MRTMASSCGKEERRLAWIIHAAGARVEVDFELRDEIVVVVPPERLALNGAEVLRLARRPTTRRLGAEREHQPRPVSFDEDEPGVRGAVLVASQMPAGGSARSTIQDMKSWVRALAWSST